LLLQFTIHTTGYEKIELKSAQFVRAVITVQDIMAELLNNVIFVPVSYVRKLYSINTNNLLLYMSAGEGWRR
jgi:hypothetical protein